MADKVKSATSTKQVTEVTLKEGEVVLASLKATSNPNKVMLEYVQNVVREDRGPNVAAMFNEGDERWDAKPRYRRHYQSAEKTAAVLKAIGITEEQLKNASEVPTKLLISNPSIEIAGKKERLVLQFNDSLSPDMGERALPIEDQAKKVIRKSGEELFFSKNGKPIFQKSSLVVESKLHSTYIEKDTELMSWEDLQAISEQSVAAGEAINA